MNGFLSIKFLIVLIKNQKTSFSGNYPLILYPYSLHKIRYIGLFMNDDSVQKPNGLCIRLNHL